MNNIFFLLFSQIFLNKLFLKIKQKKIEMVGEFN